MTLRSTVGDRRSFPFPPFCTLCRIYIPALHGRRGFDSAVLYAFQVVMKLRLASPCCTPALCFFSYRTMSDMSRSSTVDPLDQDILLYNPRTSRPARMWATTGSIPPYLQSGIPFGETLSYQRLQKLTETHSWGGYKVLAYTILSIVAHRARSKDASTVAQISLQFTYRITFPPNIAHGLPRRLNSS